MCHSFPVIVSTCLSDNSAIESNKKPTILLGHATPTKILSKVVGAGIFSRLEVAGDVMSGLAVDEIGVDVHVEFSDSRSNHCRYIYIPAAHFVTDDE